MASMSINGVVSGMDWESMIDELITNAARPAQVQVNKKTDLTNKKSLFEEMKVMVNAISSSMSALKMPSTYKAKEIEIENIGSTGSYKSVLTATVNADAEVNVYDLVVNQIATAQTNRSNQIKDSTLSNTLGSLTDNKIYISAAGQKVGIEVKADDTLHTLRSRINTTLKTLDTPLNITSYVTDNRLMIKSDYTGLGNDTVEETITYNPNGYNRLSNILVDDSNKANLSIQGYTQGKDYAVVTGDYGTEIRWNRNNDTGEVKLGKSVKLGYTMDSSDVYQSTGTYNSSEAEISGFNIIDNGTLSQRAKIVDDYGNEYYYGKDFTITNNKVVWLESAVDDTPTTNEPDAYTVTYTKTDTISSNISGTKDATDTTYTSEPDSYIVRYDDKAQGSEEFTKNKSSGYYDDITLDFSKISELYKNTTGSDLQILPVTHNSGNTSYIIDPSDSSLFKVTSGGTTYEYGKDFLIRTKNNSSDIANASWEIVWGGGTVVSDYASAKDISGTPAAKPTSGSITFSMSYDYDYTRIARVNASDNDKLLTTVFGSDFDTSKFDSSKLTIRGYTYGTDFEVDSDGEIKWLNKTSTTSSRDDPVSSTDFTALTTAYKNAYGSSSIPTVTLTDSDGVLRTYLDPEDSSVFTMTSGSNTYEYGKDYVIRVNDDRNGYTISWAITDDANGDGSTDINDASTVVTTYTKYKDLTTYGMQAAPSDGDNYNLSFSKDVTTTTKGDVNKTDTNKTLSSILSGASVPASDYGTSALTITDGTYTYTYGTDYTIDSSGNISWIEHDTGAPDDYTVTYTPASWANNVSYGSYKYDTEGAIGYSYDQLASLIGVGTLTNSSSGFQYMDLADNDTVSVTINGEEAVYGQNYVLRKNGTAINNPGCVIFETRANRIKEYRDAHSPVIAEDTSVNTSYSGNVPFNVSYSFSAAKDSTTESTVLSSFTSDYSAGKVTADKITVKGSNGLVYTYNASVTTENALNSLGSGEFAIIDGAIKFKPAGTVSNHPEEGVGYKLIYESFDALTASDTYSGSSSQEISITVDSGKGNYNDTSLSYEQILSDTGLTASSSDSDFAKYFTLTDGNNTSYTYGTDFTITQGSDTDGTSGEHNVMINWINAPANPNFTLTYTGRGEGGGEILEFSVERGNTDSINEAPEYSLFEDGTTIINYGGKSFYEGVDFDVTEDDDGNAQISWITGTDYEWYYPTPGSNYTINLTDSNGDNYSYTARRNSSDSVNIMDGSGLTTANGSITSINYNLDSYDLSSTETDSDGKTDTQKAREILGASVGSIDSSGNVSISWTQPATTSRTLPDYFTELTVSYSHDANTFELSDDAGGALLQALGFTDSNGDYQNFTAAQDAELVLDGETITRSENYLSDDYGNALIKGTAITLKGPGHVSLDISQDAEKAVESIQTFVDNYNSLMSWMNTRMTEKQLDKDSAATVDSDDFRMRWGLLHGNSLLRQTKSQMRTITSQNFTFSFTQRNSSEEIYGTMAHNGLKTVSTLRLRIGTKYVDVSIEPTDTLKDIVAKINDDTKGGPMNDIYYDDQGNKLATPLLKAEVANDLLIINSTDGSEITMSGTAAMNALKMNYTYRGLYQLGIATTSTDYGKSGELEFDTSKFMEALEDNSDEVQTLMLKFASEMDSWLKSMTTTSASGETSGTLTRQIEDLDTRINTINEYLEKYQDRLDRMEERLRTQYASAEDNFAKLSQQANSIASILQMMTNSSSSSSSSTSS
ncbi:MAG: flagellar filament capping protein FliD [Synergistaceae bacterium]|nr:flagellar filament capping protein FliD [Synergistaceae bacterium]